MENFELFTSCIESYVNGQHKQTLELVRKFGMTEFTRELHQCPVLTDYQKTDLLSRLLINQEQEQQEALNITIEVKGGMVTDVEVDKDINWLYSVNDLDV